MPGCCHAQDEHQDHTCTDACTCEHHHTASTHVDVHGTPVPAPRAPEPLTRTA